MTDTEKIQLAEDWYNDPSTTQKEKVLLEKIFPEIKPVYFLEIPAGDVAPAEEDGPLEEDIFPESSESEEQPMDEKIRQYLIQMVNAIRADDFELSGLNKEEVLAYLEKQKEQKPVKLNDDTEVGLDRALQIVKDAKGNLYNYQSDDGIYECCHAIQTLERILKSGIEQRPAEWSEEDEKCIKDIIDCLKYLEMEDTERQYNGDRNVNPKRYANMIAKLKSLRPQPHWKPSEEQMKALKEAVDEHWEADGLHPLYTLYDDLKKSYNL